MPEIMTRFLKVSKPLRYCGGEPGSVVKEPGNRLRFCLAFPDIYEIGMSHLGFKILYTKLNQSDHIACERFFAPWPDALEILGKEVMVSLESHTPVRDFDVLGFSMQYEMAYVTALQLLRRGEIPLKSRDRGETDPIIVAGGGCMLNPAPMSAFIDVFFLGEMDAALAPAMEKLQQMRSQGATRRQQLEMLNTYHFTYVPSVDPDKRALREVYMAFSDDEGITAPLIPLMQVVQDRVVVEIARGCTNGCRFCQAGMIYRPVREKSISTLYNCSMNAVDSTGYKELSLLSLDSGDYSQIEPLLDTLGRTLNQRKISLSLPSLRAETVNPELLDRIGSVRKGGFTIAPEAGTQRLRDVINKNLSEEEILAAAVYAKNAGYNGAKLYFMCGLPYETDEDILGIAELVRKIRTATRGGRFFEVTVSVSNFVPKPHTPFERFGQLPREEFYRRHRLLKDELRKEKVKLKFHDITTSAIEAAFSRGGRQVGNVLERAVEEGRYLDAWNEYFDKRAWERLFEESGFPLESISTRQWSEEEMLPWDVVDCGIGGQWLMLEKEKAAKAIPTPDCRKGRCSACGICDFITIANVEAEPESFHISPQARGGDYRRYELIFRKQGVGAFMSALDLVRIFSHLLSVAGIELKFTEGFNPQPRLVLQAPVPVGVTGEAESLLFEADCSFEEDPSILDKLNRYAPDGLEILSVNQAVWPKNLSSYEMEYHLEEDGFHFIKSALEKQEAFYEKSDKKGRLKKVDLKDYLLEIDGDNYSLKVKVTDKGGFHFPEYFRKAGFKDQPPIHRKKLAPLQKENHDGN